MPAVAADHARDDWLLFMSAITDAEHRAAVANLYVDAAARIDARWQRGRLEKRAAQLHSSQALCVSVLETIASQPTSVRVGLLQALMTEAGLGAPVQPDAGIAAEVREHGTVLGETSAGTPTSLDGLMQWSAGVVTIESKFCEAGFGACGQIKTLLVKPPDPRSEGAPAGRRVANCTGEHGVGSDSKPSTAERKSACRLTVPDGRRAPRRYWEVAPYLFTPAVLKVQQRCPFSSDNYQLMRNLAFAHEWPHRSADGWFGTLICLVDRSPHSTELRERVNCFRLLLRRELRDRVGVLSYEHIADLLAAHGEADLAAWVRRRITDVATSRRW